ncbi:hypothetical protein GJ496_004006 [Pomphorhynchus laevis]|nr:hypothetical protein GJ496_004006 [Pomphorhynchus laevis]
MSGVKSIVALALLCTLGCTLLVCACALTAFNWWPAFVIIFYLLTPFPIYLCKRSMLNDYQSSDNSNIVDGGCFVLSVIVVSAFGLPVVLARSLIIRYESMALVLAANIVIYLTMLIYYKTARSDSQLLY